MVAFAMMGGLLWPAACGEVTEWVGVLLFTGELRILTFPFAHHHILELQAEVAESNTLIAQTSPTALQRAGAAIVNLNISSQRTGLGGKTVLDLELDPAVGGGDIPEHGIRVGDIVGVQEQPSGSAKKKEKADSQRNGVNGVVLKVQPASVSVALDKEDVEVPAGKLWMSVSSLWLA
jgi:hypothetical protein